MTTKVQSPGLVCHGPHIVVVVVDATPLGSDLELLGKHAYRALDAPLPSPTQLYR